MHPPTRRSARPVALTLGALAALLLPVSGNSAIATDRPATRFVSVNSAEEPSDLSCCLYMFHPAVSNGGRFIAFTSEATNLVADDGDYRRTDVFLRDRHLGTTKQISVSDTEMPIKLRARWPAISGDGLSVSFSSNATALVVGDVNKAEDVFIRVHGEGRTELVSVASDESQGNGDSFYSAISRTGRFVAFVSYASNLVPGDNNGVADVFVRDLLQGRTERVSAGSGGGDPDGSSESETLSISARGRFVAFHSSASNLVPTDSNDATDVFVYDRHSDTTALASVADMGGQRSRHSMYPTMSADGDAVSFTSWSRLAPEDTDRRGDVYVRNLDTGETVLASIGSGGATGQGGSGLPYISADGSRVSFYSASTFSRKDPGPREDIYTRDLRAGKTRLVSIPLHQDRIPRYSYYSALNRDGSKVVFASYSDDLVDNDENRAADLFIRVYPDS